jgi:hypothetical protein
MRGVLPGNLTGSNPYTVTSVATYSTSLPAPASIPLNIQSINNSIVLVWSNPAFRLLASPAAHGVYTNVPGATSRTQTYFPRRNSFSGFGQIEGVSNAAATFSNRWYATITFYNRSNSL